ncbi:MAG: PqiC family protein [Magnetococcus sp. MYC-9]
MRRIWLFLPLLLCSACAGGSPPVRYYLLTPTASTESPTRKASHEQPLIVVEPVELPPYLNRAQIVTRSSENHLHMQQTEQWGDHLRENISRVVLENLSALLGTDRITSPTALPQERSSLRIATQISQFEQGADGRVVLKARWRLLDAQTGRHLVVQHAQFASEPIALADYAGVAAGMSQLLLEWSREMAGAVERTAAGR